MKKILLFIGIVCGIIAMNHAQTPVTFNGNALTSYINQNVTFNQTLYVCGTENHYLHLSYERLRQPEETAIYGSAAYIQDSIKCSKAILKAYVSNISVDTVRLGSTITNLTAKVTGDRAITINNGFQLRNNARPTSIPNMGDARLIICATNLEYYCPEWSGTNGASSDAEFATQHTKTMAALSNINADIYGLLEVQEGKNAILNIVNELNARTEPGRYAYINDGNAQTSTYVKIGFIYRTDKVTPVLALGRPYPSSSAYYRREYVQAFTENCSGGRFVVSLNHFKAKDGTGSESTHAARMENVEQLIDFLTQKINSNFYQDPDFLIIGDLNCSTMEEPIRYIADHGYENQLIRFSPNEYSYIYDDEVEYLDHVFATSTMATQVTNAAPYHLNADEHYRHYYPYGDQTMYRYSDHDPIIVGVKLSESVGIQNNTINSNNHIIYSQDGKINIQTEKKENISIYDMCGKTIYNGVEQECSVSATTGIYIVKIGNYTKKIFVEQF